MGPDKNHRHPPQAPLTFLATVESIHAVSRRICHNTQEVLDAVVSRVTPDNATFENTLRPLIEEENDRQLLSNVLGLYSKVSTCADIRKASAEAQSKVSNFMIDCNMREDIFCLVDSVFQKNEHIDPESRKLLTEERRKYIRNGLALSSHLNRERLKKIQKQLNAIRSEFNRNLDEKDNAIWFTREELEGVPEDLLSGLHPGTGELKLRVLLKDSDTGPLMMFARNPETRRETLTKMKLKDEKNVPLFTEAILLRNEAASLLGYDNHAAFKLDTKMAKSPKTVIEFLEDLRDRAFKCRSKNIAELQGIKKAELSSHSLPDEELYKWDIPYYTRLLKEEKYSVDQQKIAEYFPLLPTVAAMLKLFGRLFGFVFIEIQDNEDRARISPTGKASDLTWHEDVILYSVWNDDEGGGFAGYIYLDLHPRPGKYGNAQCYPVQLGFSRADGQRYYPSTALLTNFTKPTNDKPSLLKHHEVVLLFHELGHGMHDLSGRFQYSRFHGAETVGDFNEAPSQMLENWCWDPVSLKLLSSHYKTGEPLPDAMIQALVQTKHVQSAIGLLAQLRMCLFDMAVHTAKEDEEGKINVEKIYSEYVDLDGVKGPEDRHGFASYRHLLHGYDAGLYGYLWSKVNAMAMFDFAFKNNPMDEQNGRRYRHMVLEKGGSQDEMETLVQFLGAKPRSDAFFRDLGLD